MIKPLLPLIPNLDLRFGLELELAMNTLADYKLIKLGSDLKPQFIIRVRNSCGFRQVSTFEPTLEQETVGLDLLGNWIFVLFELVFVLFLLCEVVLVALDVVVVDDCAELLAHGLYLGLPPRGVVEHLDLVRQLQTWAGYRKYLFIGNIRNISFNRGGHQMLRCG